ncbi:MAG: family 16 glycosylhydrolase [Polyangiaceae bacterium]|nr:family 16 glycosylhydrolase [Polyangiaceae bacterium]
MKPCHSVALACAIAVSAWGTLAHATKSAEFYTTTSYQYGRFEASIRFPAGSGVIGAFFLWKDGSEVAGTFWNELDIEKVGADCALDTNAFYGDPEQVHTMDIPVTADLCGGFHTYAYEWTPEYIAWFVDGTEVRRETGETATAYAENATEGMQLRFNIWPGDASFGGVFDPSILPVVQQIDWVQYSSYANGAFQLAWREDFNATTAPTGWARGTWDSPKGLSTHSDSNVTFADGVAILALTDDAGTGTGGTTSGTGGAAPGTGGTDPLPTGGSTATGGGGAISTDTTVTPFGETDEESGCACRVGTARPRHGAGFGWLLGALLVGFVRWQRQVAPRGRRP